jgi:hypothetical protein
MRFVERIQTRTQKSVLDMGCVSLLIYVLVTAGTVEKYAKIRQSIAVSDALFLIF